MNHSLYGYSLCVALPLMIFFGSYFILAKTPDKAIFDNYLRSRRIMGAALLLLAANYAVHFFFEIRFLNVQAAILMNLSTYFLCYWLFSSALTALLDRFYLTVIRFKTHLLLWLLFTGLSSIILLCLPTGIAQTIGLFIMAIWLISYGLFLARRLIRTYQQAIRLFDDNHSDHIGAYIRWLSIFTYWAVIFGVGCGLLTFLPDKYIFLWILSSIPFYIYLYHSYMNYLLFYEQVEQALETEVSLESAAPSQDEQLPPPSCYADMTKKLIVWIDSHGYIRPGLTLKELSEALNTNRTYLSGYIKTTYNMSFRDWITGLRIEYAKQQMLAHPELTIADISERSGFLSFSHFMKTFKEKQGYSPAKWKKMEADKNIC